MLTSKNADNFDLLYFFTCENKWKKKEFIYTSCHLEIASHHLYVLFWTNIGELGYENPIDLSAPSELLMYFSKSYISLSSMYLRI